MPYQIGGSGPWQYVDRIGAQRYFDGRLGTTAWDGARISDQDKALAQATTLIDRLNFAGAITVPNQPLQFPRGGDLSVPQPILSACAEIALKLLDDVDVNQQMDSVATKQAHMSSVKTERDTSFVSEWTMAGIPSPIAWSMLRPYLLDSLALSLTRAG